MSRFQNHIVKVCALVIVTLIERHRGDRDRDDHILVVPEANTGWVLIPFVRTVLLFSWRQFSRAKA
jgi:hypothetical protein